MARFSEPSRNDIRVGYEPFSDTLHHDVFHTSSGDDIGRLIHWSLRDSVAKAEPPTDVWLKILARVQEMNAPMKPRRQLRRALLPLAPMVQAVVISALLLAFGLGVERNVSMSRRDYQVRSTPTVQKALAAQEPIEDVLRGYMLVHKEQDLPSYKGGYTREAEKLR